jgi:hypothetical protein
MSTSTAKIDPKRAYTVAEFLEITGISREKLSRMRRAGLVVRDTGVPTILGSDWVEYCRNAPVALPKRRGRPFPSGAAHPRSKKQNATPQPE